MNLVSSVVKKKTYITCFFNCCVAVNASNMVSHTMGLDVGANFESIGQLWLSQKCHGSVKIYMYFCHSMELIENSEWFGFSGFGMDGHEDGAKQST